METEIPRVERRVLLALLLILLILRGFNLFNYRFDTDEPQHLHIVWGWTHGLLQYKDVFDNHAPLFHMLWAPIFALFPERADILFPMRMTMLPLFFGSLWMVYLLGRRLYSPRVGLWAAIFAGLYRQYFLPGVEFRADQLWTFLWMGLLLLLAGRPLRPRRILLAGLILGAAFSASMKTTLLLLALVLAALPSLFFLWRAKGADWRRFSVGAGIFFLAALVVPGVIIGYFASRHALGDLYYGVIRHNIVPGLKRWAHFHASSLWFPVAVPLSVLVASALFRETGNRALAWRRALTGIAPWFYITLLYSFWPDITREDYMPFVPAAAVGFTAALFFLIDRFGGRLPAWSGVALPAGIAAAEIVCLLAFDTPWHNHTGDEVTMIGAGLKLTHPGEYIMDAKSGLIYRQRPFFYALETITRAHIFAGTIVDTIPEDLINKQTAVALLVGLKTKWRSHQFIAANYLPLESVPDVRVLGKILEPSKGGSAYDFTIPIPAEYVVLGAEGPVEGMLDGKSVREAGVLQAGPHRFIASAPAGRLALFWERAFQEGYRPAVFRK